MNNHHSNAYLAEAELLQQFRQHVALANEKTGSQYAFIHGTGDRLNEGRTEKWNATKPGARACGEIEGQSAFGHPHRLTVFLHQDEHGPTFRLLDRIHPPVVYAQPPIAVFNIDCDVATNLRPVLAPDYDGAEPRLLLVGLQASGSLEPAGLMRSIRDLCQVKRTLAERIVNGEGPDHWTEQVEMLRSFGGN